MEEERPNRLKIVDVSFMASFKFWLAFLVVQIIATIVVFVIFAGIIIAMISQLGRYPYSIGAILEPMLIMK